MSAAPGRTPRRPRLAQVRAVLNTSLFPVHGAEGGTWTIWLVAAGFWVALFRNGLTVFAARLWAEDGSIFIHQAATSESFLGPLFTTYAGYVHVVPRLVASAFQLLPFGAVAWAIVVVCAAVQALIAGTAFWVLTGLGVKRWLAVAPSAAVCAVPVGVEVTLNLANLQWFLLFGSLIVLFWQPTSKRGLGLQGALAVAAMVSSPFAFVPLAMVAGRALVVRSRSGGLLLLTSGVATAVQLTMMFAARGSRPMHSGVGVSTLGAAFLRRVIADGVLGLGRLHGSRYSPQVTAGLVVMALFLVLAVLAIWRAGTAVGVQLVTLFGLSLVTYTVPMILSGAPGIDPIFLGRYAVAPALLFLCAIAVGASASIGPGVLGWVGTVLTAAFLVVTVFSLVSTYPLHVGLRDRGQPWNTQVERVDEACEGAPDALTERMMVPPGPNFDFSLSCAQVRNW